MNDPEQEIAVDFVFLDARPGFGDLFQICGTAHPNFPPEGRVDFRPLANLQVSQIDDYFGVHSQSEDGDDDDVAIWLYPLVNGRPVDHHPGPFDALRLSYDLLRNPEHRLDHFLAMLDAFRAQLPATPIPAIDDIKRRAQAAINGWTALGLTPGSHKARAHDT